MFVDLERKGRFGIFNVVLMKKEGFFSFKCSYILKLFFRFVVFIIIEKVMIL